MKKTLLFSIFILLAITLSACTQSINAVQPQSQLQSDGTARKNIPNDEKEIALQSQNSSDNETAEATALNNAAGESAVNSESVAAGNVAGAPAATVDDKKTIVYQNSEYGFKFTLPGSWSGFRIIEEKWEGVVSDDTQGEKVVETGPMILIRHLLWSDSKPRQDIPIMVFTLSQWEKLQQDKFHIGAAPIGPSELGRNNKYVFALPARYNYAFPEGYEEVEQILQSNPFEPVTME